MRLDLSTQQDAIIKAFQDFSELCLRLRDSNQTKIPDVSLLCALALSSRELPEKVANAKKLCDLWKQEAQQLRDSCENDRELFSDDFTTAVQIFAMLPKDQARDLLRAFASAEPHDELAASRW